jgi:hypothetical protein
MEVKAKNLKHHEMTSEVFGNKRSVRRIKTNTVCHEMTSEVWLFGNKRSVRRVTNTAYHEMRQARSSAMRDR